jgi:ubiquinone/menaquinone biosynthesis C-methylase UbiE
MTATPMKPRWAGDDFLSRCVNLMIRTKPLYRLMKQQARQVLIKTAEKHGVAWRQAVQELSESGASALLPYLTNQSVTYPGYYQVPFHAYDEGNLCWQAAFEAESATYAMALRVWPQEHLTWQTAQERLRDSFHAVLAEHGPAEVHDILDMGCSVGISTRSLHQYYSRTQSHPVHTVGLDLSPYMLAVAKTRDPQAEIKWLHGQAEATGFPDACFDLVTLQFVTHELPRTATQEIFQEAFRLLRTGGCLAIVDNNPRSPVIQNLPPVLFTLMKSTEPWSDDYYTFDLEAAMTAAGFEQVVTVASDPRHRTVVAKKVG